MKQLVLALAVLAAGTSLAQEIGTEITPTTPNSGVQPQQTTTPPPAEPNKGYVYKPKGAKEETAAPGAGGPKVSGSSGDFGIRAGFGTSNTIPGAGATAAVAAPSVGISYFGTDAFKLLIDLGFGMSVAGAGVGLALSTTIGFDYLFRTPADAMRPFFHFAGFFSMAGSSNFLIGFGAQLGFGAEYFFNPAFSVNARLLLAVPMAIPGDFVLGILTVSPGVGATWYL